MQTWHVLNFNCGVNFIAQEMYIFKKIYQLSRTTIDPRIRGKYIQYIEYYRKKFPWPLTVWENYGFGMNCIIQGNDWGKVYRNIIKESF